ncbi:MAG: Ig-like domain-containing protein [Xenococcus sp. MO_188.B8]|nr:Ig-like domain-containing protein [Xenococcus sp. MO_188.B8]
MINVYRLFLSACLIIFLSFQSNFRLCTPWATAVNSYELKKAKPTLVANKDSINNNHSLLINKKEILTHKNLSVEIPIETIVKKDEKLNRTFKAITVQQGKVSFSEDYKTIIFTPKTNYVGKAFFKLIDGSSEEELASVNIAVSDAPLVGLDFIKRNPKLKVGDEFQLKIIGNFTDAENVPLPEDYVTWSSDKPIVATVDNKGLVRGINDGVSIFKIEKAGINAFTVSRIGRAEHPQSKAELESGFAEFFGLKVYPQAATYTPKSKQQILIGANGGDSLRDLTPNLFNTRYFVSNPQIIKVNSNGILSTLKEGKETITVIDGASEAIIPIKVTKSKNERLIDSNGGVVENESGALLFIPPNAVKNETQIKINSLPISELTAPLPKDFDVLDSFHLDLGKESLNIPVRLSIKNQHKLPVGKEVFILKEGELADKNYHWNPMWFIVDRGLVNSQGEIVSLTPPWMGITKSDNYIVALPKFQYSLGKFITDFPFIKKFIAGTAVVFNDVATEAVDIDINIGSRQDSVIASFLQRNLNTLPEVRVISTAGNLALATNPKIKLNNKQESYLTLDLSDINNIKINEFDYLTPILKSAKFDFATSEIPILYLTVSDLFTNPNDLSGIVDIIESLVPTFKYFDQTYTGDIIPELCKKLDTNTYLIAVRVPQSVVLTDSDLGISRGKLKLTDISDSTATKMTIENSSDRTISFQNNLDNADLILSTHATKNQISVLDALDLEEEIIKDDFNSQNLLIGQIPLNIDAAIDGKVKDLVATSNATRAYVALESGSVALVDIVSLQQVDINPNTPKIIDSITLPNNAIPSAIAISSSDSYIYIADANRGNIYLIDLNSRNDTYHQVVKTISLPDANRGIKAIATDLRRDRLFVTTVSNSITSQQDKIYVIYIDRSPKKSDKNVDSSKLHKIIGSLKVDRGIEKIFSSSDPTVMFFTNSKNDSKGLGRIKITNNEPKNFQAAVDYIPLKLGKSADKLNIKGVASIVVTKDGEYGFVAAKESGNIGVIAHPLNNDAKAIAATQPIPNALTEDVAITRSQKYLFAAYTGIDRILAFDINEIISTLKSDSQDLTAIPLEKINPKISVAADLEIINQHKKQERVQIPHDSDRTPVFVGDAPISVKNASFVDWLKLLPVQDNN